MAASETRVTRGKLLKRAGVGAAALGAGSMISAAGASAAAAPSTACIAAGGCGSAFQPCMSHCGCNCAVTLEGCCICMQNVTCTGLTQCTNSGQCPPGWACATGGCGTTPTHGACVPPCGYHGPLKVPCVSGSASAAGSFAGK